MAKKSAKKVNLAKSQAVSLLDTLRASVSDVRDVNLNLDILLENLGIGAGLLGENLTSDEVLDSIANKGKILKRAISAIKQIKKSKSDLEALTRPAVVKHTQEGRGPSLAYAINAQFGIGKRRMRLGDILTAKEIEDVFVGPTATQEQIVEGRRKDESRRERIERTRKEGERRARLSRAHQSFAWTYDNWADEQRDLFELTKRYGSRQKAEEFYRNKQRETLYEKAPWMKTLVKAGVIEQKHIPIISKKLDKITRSIFKQIGRSRPNHLEDGCRIADVL